MKKVFLLCFLALFAIEIKAQTSVTNNLIVKSVSHQPTSQQIMTRDTITGRIGYLKRKDLTSSGGGTLPTLDQVLTTGNITTKEIVVNDTDLSSTVTISNTGRVSTEWKGEGDKTKTELLYYGVEGTNIGTGGSMDINLTNRTASGHVSFQFSPNKAEGNFYTITTRDDFKTINNNSILGTGNINISGGLQETLDINKTWTPDSSTYSTYFSIDDSAIGTDNSLAFNTPLSTFTVGPVGFSIRSGAGGLEHHFTHFSGDVPTDTSGSLFFKLPNDKVVNIGTDATPYVLTTRDEVTMQKVMETGIGYGTVTSPNGKNKVEFQTSAVDAVLMAGYVTTNISSSDINQISTSSVKSINGRLFIEEAYSTDGNVSNKKTNIGITTPIANTNIKFPAPSIDGTYTLATTDQITTPNAVLKTGNDTKTGTLSLITPNVPSGTSSLNALTPIVVTGGKGGDNTNTTGTVTAGNASAINIKSGAGGAVAGVTGTGISGNGGTITILAGAGGLATGSGTLFPGMGGNAILQAGSSFGGVPGTGEVKAGNNDATAGLGGNVHLVAGWGNNNHATDPLYDGTIFIGSSSAGVVRGNAIFGDITDNRTDRIQVNGSALISGAVKGNSFVKSGGTASQFLKADGSVDSTTYLSTIKTINGVSLVGSGNVVVGAPAQLESNLSDLTVWNNGKGNVTQNTSFGDEALRANVGGYFNTALGYKALRANTSGNMNTAIGSSVLEVNTTGGSNTGVGHSVLVKLIDGTSNTALGSGALTGIINANYNTAVGASALYSTTTGEENTGLGNASLSQNTTGSGNVGVGHTALNWQSTGSNNIAIGTTAGTYIGTLTDPNTVSNNSIFIGTNSRPLANNTDNEIVIGNLATGSGPNTATIGNQYTNKTVIKGDVVSERTFKVTNLATAPTSATDTGVLGEIRYTAGYIYVCIATNTWVRSALTTW